MSVDRVTLRWVAVYTRGLPDAVGAARRCEIESDLWEQRVDTGTGLRVELAILSRTVRGAPADVSWRRSQRRARRLPRPRTLARVLGWAVAIVSYLFMVGTFGWGTTGLVGLDLYGEDWAPGDVEAYSRISGALLALLVGGTAVILRFPRAGATLVVAALVVTPIVFWWAAPLYVPLEIAVGAATITVARRTHRRRALAG